MRIVDVSNNNPSVSMLRLKLGLVAGVYHKATEGHTFADGFFAVRRNEARKVRMPFGAYHFARPTLTNAEEEAKWFCAHVGKLDKRDLRPALDMELNPHGLNLNDLVKWSREFNHAVAGTLGVWPLFYSFPEFILRMEAKEVIGAGLWLAAYGANDGKRHPITPPSPWQHVVLHQYTSNGQILGVSGKCDISYTDNMKPLRAHP